MYDTTEPDGSVHTETAYTTSGVAPIAVWADARSERDRLQAHADLDADLSSGRVSHWIAEVRRSE